jgi:ABC-type dipeptide transport system, periplasmic component
MPLPVLKRKLMLPVMVVVAMCLQGCAGKSSNDKTIFRLNYSSGYLESIDPAFSKALYMMWTCHMVYNTLIECDEQLQLTPSLAKSWEISDDGLTYTFHLRDDVYFHDAPQFAGGKGRKMTATDVVYSFQRVVNPQVASTGSWIFNERIAEKDPFVAIDDTTFQLKLRKPFRPMLAILSMQYCCIVPREVTEHWGKDFRSHPCGTGPFMLKYWDEGNILVLHKNPRYWEQDAAGNKLPYADAVEISFIDSKATEFFMFMQGKLDFVNGVDGSFKDLVMSKAGDLKPEYKSKFKLNKQTYLNTEYIGFLTDTTAAIMQGEATRNVLVRQAINYAIDRQKIVTYFKNGFVLPATSGFIPAGMPGHDSSGSYGYHYDPKKATELLAKAGYPGGKGMKTLTILTPDNWSDIVNFVATQLQEIGIPVQVEIIQPNILKQQMSRSQAVMFRGLWLADYPDAETFLVVFNSRQPAPPNYTRFNSKEFDQLYDEAANAPDSIRFKLYRKLDSLAISQAPLIPLFYDRIMHFTQNNVTDLQTNPMNIIGLKAVKKQ